MDLIVTYGGLQVDGAMAQHPCDLAAVLREAEQHINNALDALKAKYPAGNPSIWVLYLGLRESTLSEAGQTSPQQGLYTNVDMLQQPFHDYWQAVLDAGFTPEAREASSFLGAPAGVYLLAKRPA